MQNLKGVTTSIITTKNISIILFVLLLVTVFSFGCGYPPALLLPDVGKIEINKKIPIEVGLLITEDTSKYVVFKKAEVEPPPCRLFHRSQGISFPLGNLLESASLQAFSQVFEKVTLVRTLQEAKNFKLYIEPGIEDFNYTYFFATGCKTEGTTKSKVKINIRLFSGEIKMWGKTVESPEQGGYYDTWVHRDGQSGVGKSVSDAMISALKEISKEISKDERIFDNLK